MTPQSSFTLTPAHQYTTFVSIMKYVINLTLTQQPAVAPPVAITDHPENIRKPIEVF